MLSVEKCNTEAFSEIRPKIIGPNGETYAELRRQLKPHWFLVWLDMLLTPILGLAFLHIVVQMCTGSIFWQAVSLIPGGAIGGLIVHKMTLFLHESAHFNLSPNRKINDVMADIYVGRFLFTSAKQYRLPHLTHHRLLGSVEDPERSYFLPLTIPRIIGALFGSSVIASMRVGSVETASRIRLTNLILGFSTHLICVAFIFSFFGLHGLTLWILSAYSWMPFWVTIRQTLEHRSITADPQADYTQLPHGPLTRNFSGIGTIFLGGVGFSNHLLHHWDPGISYTQLSSLRKKLSQSVAGMILNNQTSSYTYVFRKLIGR